MNTLERLKKEIDKEELIEIARDLIRIPSENPPGDETEVANVVKNWLKKFGFKIKEYKSKEKRVNVIGTIEGNKSGKTLIWNGHMDVVPAGDLNSWKHDPYEAKVVGKRIYGRGSADMKGGIASMIEGIATLQRAEIDINGTFIFQAVADEETGGKYGTEYLVKNTEVNGDAAIVGEPTELDIYIAERGLVWPKITVYGKAAHGSTPHLGVNAINKMVKLISKIEKLKFEKEHELLGKPTINIGTISGGTKTNIVADKCTLTIDRRLLPNETKEEAITQIKDLIDKLKEEEKINIEMEIITSAEPSSISPEENIVKVAENVIEKVNGTRPRLTGMTAVTDARFLINQRKIPSILLGPGSLKQAHISDEFVEIEDLEKASMIYALITEKFFNI